MYEWAEKLGRAYAHTIRRRTHRALAINVGMDGPQTKEPSVNQIIRIGMGTSKHVFQLHGVNAGEQPILRKKMRRREMVDFFAKCPPTVIAIEARAASHHWARLLTGFGHDAKLIAPQLM